MKCTRRTVIATGLTGLAAAGTSLVHANPPKQHWDRTVDLLIVGTGFARLSAAIEAKRAGASPVLIEMMSFTGGNSRITGGGIAVPGSPMQAEKGIKDSPELILADMLKASNNINHPELARTVAFGARDAYDWLVNDLKLPCLKTEDSLWPSEGSSRGQGRLNVTHLNKVFAADLFPVPVCFHNSAS